ncbi:MAG: lipopolysaccharide biosynthesis protein, partial [bacterium]
SISRIIANISTGNIEKGIVLAENQEKAVHLFIFCLSSVLLISILSFVIILSGHQTWVSLAGFQNMPGIFYLLPVMIFTMGSNRVYQQWFNRYQQYRGLSLSMITQSVVTAGVKLLSGVILCLQKTGLIIGSITGQIAGLSYLIIKNPHLFPKIRSLSSSIIRTELKLNQNFFWYLTPMSFLNTFSVDILIYALNIIYSSTIVGWYHNAFKVINYPLDLLSRAFTTVFYRKMSETRQQKKLYLLSYFINLFIATILLLPVLLWGPEIFSFVLGESWKPAGEIAVLLVPLSIASYSTRSISQVFSVKRKNQILLIWQSIYLLAAIMVIFIKKDNEMTDMLQIFVIVCSSLYFILAVIGYFEVSGILKIKPDTFKASGS